MTNQKAVEYLVSMYSTYAKHYGHSSNYITAIAHAAIKLDETDNHKYSNTHKYSNVVFRDPVKNG